MKPKSSIRPLLALVTTIVLTGAPAAFATSGSWNYDGTNSTSLRWDTNASWLGTPALVPDGVGESAAFSFNITASRSITLNGDKTIGSLTLGDPTSSYFNYTLSGGNPAGKLIFDNTDSTDATLSLPVAATTATNSISAGVLLNDNLVLSSAVTSLTVNALTISGIIADGGANKSLTKNDPFLMTLSNANTYGGGTTINAGKITASNAASFGTGVVTVTGDATVGGQANLTATSPIGSGFSISGIGASEGPGLNYGAIRYGTTSGNITTTGTITVASSARIGVSTGATGNMNGVLTGSAALELNSSAASQGGTLNLNGTASGYTGAFTLSQGRLNLGTNIGGNVSVASGASLAGNATIGGTLALAGANLYADPTGPLQSGGTTVSGVNAVFFTKPLTAVPVTILNSTGAISGAGSFVPGGSANYHPDAAFTVGSNAVTFTSTINTLTWAGVTGVWDFAVGNWEASEQFYHLDNVIFNDDATTAGVTLASGVTVLPNTITVNNPTLPYSITGAGSIGGGASLTKTGASILTVTNSNSFTGGITLSEGTLAMSTAGFGSAASLTMSDATTFRASSVAAMTVATNANISGNVTIGDGTNYGAITLTGNHTFANNTDISVPARATVSLNGSNLLPANLSASTPFSGAYNAYLLLGGTSTLTANTTITNSAAYNSNNAISITGTLTDGTSSFSLTKEGVGRLTLSAANTYDGGTTINSGLIYAQNAMSFGTGAVAVADGAQALLAGSGTIPNAFSISGIGIPLPGFAGEAPDGAIQLNFSNQYLTGPISLTGDARITGYFSTSNAILSGVIGDGGESYALDFGSPGAVNGCGTLTVTGNNTYSGGTYIYRTVVRAYSNNAFGSGDVEVGGDNSTTLITRLEVADVTIPNKIILDSIGKSNSTATYGVITCYPGDTTTVSTATINGNVDIYSTPANGGHFAAQGNVSNILRVNGEITSYVPVILSNGIVELGGGGSGYTNLTQAKDTLRVVATNGISTVAVVDQGSTGTAVLDLNGFNQTLAGLTRMTGANSVSVTNSGSSKILTLAPTNDFSYPGSFGSSINLAISGSAVSTLTGASAFAATTSVSGGGTLNIPTASTFGGATSVTSCQSGGALAGAGTIGGSLAMSSGSALKVNIANGNLKVTGTTTVSGTVTVKLTGTPGVTTTILESTGTLTASPSNFVLDNAGSYSSSSFSIVDNKVILTTSSLNLTWTANGGSSWVVNGLSNWTDGINPQKFFNGDAVTFDDTPLSDQTVLIPGTVQPGAMTFNNSARKYTLADDGSGLVSATTLTKSGTGTAVINVPLTLASGMTLNAGNLVIQPLESAFNPTVLDKPISGAGTLTIANDSYESVDLTNSNTGFSGPVIVSRGELKATISSALGTGTLTFGDADTLVTDTASLTLETGVSISNPVVCSASALDASITGAGSIIGAATLTKRGEGSLTISNANTFTGATTIVGGTLLCTASGAIGSGSTITLGAADTGATDTILFASAGIASPIALSPLASSKAIIEGSGPLSGPVALNGRDLWFEGYGSTITGAISGNGNLKVNGSGTVVIAGESNTFNGDVQVLSGNLRTGNGGGTHNCIPDTSSVLLGADSVFSLGVSDTINGLTGLTSSSLQAGAYTLTVGAGNSSFSFDGQWQSGTLVKTGTGTMSLNGVNTSTGYLEVQGGTVLVNQSSAARIDVKAGGTLGGSGNVFFAGLPVGGHLPFYGFIAPGNQGVGTFTIDNPLALYGGSGFNLQIADWNSTTPGTGHDLLVCPNLSFSGGSFIVNLDCTGLTNFTETAKSFVVVQGTETLYPSGINTTTINVSNFPGTGTWTLGRPGIYNNTLSLYYTPRAYGAWIAGYPTLTGNDALPSADPDFDGLNNLLEYVLGGNPTTSSTSVVPTQLIDPSSLVFTYDRNDDSKSDTIQVVQWSNDLVDWHDIPVGATSAGNVTIVDNGATDHVSVAIPRTNELNGRLTARLKVTLIP